MDSLRAIVDRIGGDLRNGGRAASVPGPGHSRRDRSLSLAIGEDGRVIHYSFAGDEPAAIEAYLGLDRGTPHLRRRTLTSPSSRRPVRDDERAAKAAFCQAMWEASHPAPGSIVETYLRSRGIVGAVPPALRFHPKAPLTYFGVGRHPSMVAMVTGATGVLVGLRVTPLRPDGSGKALSAPSSVFLGSVQGGAIRLAPLPFNGALVVAEGVETALSFRDLTSAPVWSCLSASGMAAFVIPDAVRDLTIAADADDAGAGIEAAQKLAERVPAGCACRILSAPSGQDWNDVLRAA